MMGDIRPFPYPDRAVAALDDRRYRLSFAPQFWKANCTHGPAAIAPGIIPTALSTIAGFAARMLSIKAPRSTGIGPASLCRSSSRRGRPPSARGRCLGSRCISPASDVL